uniref:U2 protein n=1 Tax=Parsley severe stunt associated virus TaxID=2558055 RepID=A0A6G7BND3_9VIRU|nr:U2 protein [Parsley severe stunt associated virus]
MASYRKQFSAEESSLWNRIRSIKERQDVFWNTYEDLLRSNEDIVGEFCKFHGRRVLKYPLMPVEAPCRWVHKIKTVYDIRVEDCPKCRNSERIIRHNDVFVNDENLRDLYDSGNYRYKVYY